MSAIVAIFEGAAAQLIYGQAMRLCMLGDVHIGMTNDGTKRLLVYSESSGKVAVIPWIEIAAIAVRAGVDRDTAQAKH